MTSDMQKGTGVESSPWASLVTVSRERIIMTAS